MTDQANGKYYENTYSAVFDEDDALQGIAVTIPGHHRAAQGGGGKGPPISVRRCDTLGNSITAS